MIIPRYLWSSIKIIAFFFLFFGAQCRGQEARTPEAMLQDGMKQYAGNDFGGAAATLQTAHDLLASRPQPPEAIFESKIIVAIPPQIVDPRLVIDEFEAPASRPVLDEKIMSIQPSDLSLPDVPMVKANPNLNLDPNALAFAVAGAQFGSGMGGGGEGSGFNFFGISGRGRFIVFLIDMSGSMVSEPRSRSTWNRLEVEFEKALNELGPRARFNLLTFAGETDAFRRTGVEATSGNIQSAMRWLNSRNPAQAIPKDMGSVQKGAKIFGRTKFGGTELHVALAQAFRMKPDMIVILSDGEPSFNSKTVTRLADGGNVSNSAKLRQFITEQYALLPAPVPIHTVAYIPDGGEAFLQQVASENQGTYKKIDFE